MDFRQERGVYFLKISGFRGFLFFSGCYFGICLFLFSCFMAMGAVSGGFMGLGCGFKFFPVFSDYYGFSSGFFLVFSGFFPDFFRFFSG